MLWRVMGEDLGGVGGWVRIDSVGVVPRVVCWFPEPVVTSRACSCAVEGFDLRW